MIRVFHARPVSALDNA